MQLLVLISSYKCRHYISSFFYNVYNEKKQITEMSDAFSLFLKAIINNWLVGETFECLP